MFSVEDVDGKRAEGQGPGALSDGNLSIYHAVVIHGARYALAQAGPCVEGRRITVQGMEREAVLLEVTYAIYMLDELLCHVYDLWFLQVLLGLFCGSRYQNRSGSRGDWPGTLGRRTEGSWSRTQVHSLSSSHAAAAGGRICESCRAGRNPCDQLIDFS